MHIVSSPSHTMTLPVHTHWSSISCVCASTWMKRAGLSAVARLRSGYQMPFVVREAPVSSWMRCCVLAFVTR